MSHLLPDGDVSGIPVFRTPSVDGRTTASLVVGVGLRDETARTAGLAHLVEHLVMRAVGRVTIDHNASTDVDSIQFYARGDADRVGDFLSRVCAAIGGLADVAPEAIEAERRSVAAEVGDGGETSGDGPLLRRYGARGLGLTDYGQPAHRSFTREQVQAFAARWMHDGNVALVVAGELPPELHLRLPGGSAPERPALEALPIDTPAWMPNGWAPLALTFEIGGRATGAPELLGSLIELRLMDELRHARGLIYSVQLASFAVADTRLILGIVLDPATADVEATLVAAAQVLTDIAAGRIAEQDLEHARSSLMNALGDPSVGDEFAQSAAIRLVRGEAPLDPDAIIGRWRTTGPDELARLLADAGDTLLVLAQTETLEQATVDAVGLRSILTPPHTLEGTRFTQLMGRAPRDEVQILSPRWGKGMKGTQLMITAESIALLTGDQVLEVRLADIAAVGRQKDGTLLFDRLDGWDLVVRPAQWRDGGGSIAAFVERVPAELIYERETSIDG